MISDEEWKRGAGLVQVDAPHNSQEKLLPDLEGRRSKDRREGTHLQLPALPIAHGGNIHKISEVTHA